LSAALAWPLAVILAGDSVLDLGIPVRHPPPASDGCSPDARVEVNLGALRPSLGESRSDPKRRDELLAQIKLSLPREDGEDGRPMRFSAMMDEAVTFEAGRRPDRVLQLLFRAGDEDEPSLELVQVLRPLGDRAYCALGPGLSKNDGATRPIVRYSLTFPVLLRANEKVADVWRVFEDGHDSETRQEFWAVRGGVLRKIFDESVGSMHVAPNGETTTRVADLVRNSGDGYPTRLELREMVKRGGCEVREGNAPCDDGGGPAKTTIFVFDGARYVRAKK
jgi:hypothetical protein